MDDDEYADGLLEELNQLAEELEETRLSREETQQIVADLTAENASLKLQKEQREKRNQMLAELDILQNEVEQKKKIQMQVLHELSVLQQQYDELLVSSGREAAYEIETVCSDENEDKTIPEKEELTAQTREILTAKEAEIVINSRKMQTPTCRPKKKRTSSTSKLMESSSTLTSSGSRRSASSCSHASRSSIKKDRRKSSKLREQRQVSKMLESSTTLLSNASSRLSEATKSDTSSEMEKDSCRKRPGGILKKSRIFNDRLVESQSKNSSMLSAKASLLDEIKSSATRRINRRTSRRASDKRMSYDQKSIAMDGTELSVEIPGTTVVSKDANISTTIAEPEAGNQPATISVTDLNPIHKRPVVLDQSNSSWSSTMTGRRTSQVNKASLLDEIKSASRRRTSSRGSNRQRAGDGKRIRVDNTTSQFENKDAKGSSLDISRRSDTSTSGTATGSPGSAEKDSVRRKSKIREKPKNNTEQMAQSSSHFLGKAPSGLLEAIKGAARPASGKGKVENRKPGILKRSNTPKNNIPERGSTNSSTLTNKAPLLNEIRNAAGSKFNRRKGQRRTDKCRPNDRTQASAVRVASLFQTEDNTLAKYSSESNRTLDKSGARDSHIQVIASILKPSESPAGGKMRKCSLPKVRESPLFDEITTKASEKSKRRASRRGSDQRRRSDGEQKCVESPASLYDTEHETIGSEDTRSQSLDKSFPKVRESPLSDEITTEASENSKRRASRRGSDQRRRTGGERVHGERPASLFDTEHDTTGSEDTRSPPLDKSLPKVRESPLFNEIRTKACEKSKRLPSRRDCD